jgi:hypothetical protein
LGTGALKITSPLVLSLGQAFVHHDLRNSQPEPFFDAHREPLKLKTRNSND